MKPETREMMDRVLEDVRTYVKDTREIVKGISDPQLRKKLIKEFKDD